MEMIATVRKIKTEICPKCGGCGSDLKEKDPGKCLECGGTGIITWVKQEPKISKR
jgi:DnaJ-class molecular chaperone